MKVLLDEQLSGQIARLLRERGLDAEAVVERADLLQAPDSVVMDVALREERAVVSNNIQDFRPIAAQRIGEGRGHAGLILLPSSRPRGRDAIGALANAIEAVMRAHPQGMQSAEYWIPPRS